MRLPFLAGSITAPVGTTQNARAIALQSTSATAITAAAIAQAIALQGQFATAAVSSSATALQGQFARAEVRAFAQALQGQFATATVTTGVYSNGYLYQFEIRLPAWPGATATTTNFLLPFNEVNLEFRTVANGGKVSSSAGNDIRFETNGGTKLGHKLIAYDGSTGRVVALVNMPRAFASAESIYCYVGKTGASAEEDATAARAGGWLAWYCGNSGTDLTGQSRTLTPNSAPPSAVIGNWPASDADGTADYFSSASPATWLSGLSALTAISFHEADATTLKHEAFNVATGTPGAGAATAGELSLHFNDTTDNRLTAVCKFGSSSIQYQSANDRQTVDPQAVAYVFQSGQQNRMVIDGVLDVPSSRGANPSGTTNITDTLEWGRGFRGDLAYWDGKLSFLGFCSTAQSNAALESMTAAFADARKVYGLSSSNRPADSNLSPVALAISGSGRAGVAATYNVGTLGGYDPNGDALTCTAASIVSGSATVTVGTGGNITVTPSGTAAQTVVVRYTISDGSKTSAGRLYLTVGASTPGTVTHAAILANPFNRASAVHTPLGANVRLGIPESTLDAKKASPTYTAGTLNARGRLALVKKGGLRLGSTDQGVKRRFLITTDNALFPERVIEWYGPGKDKGTGDGIDPPFRQRMPPNTGDRYSKDVGGDNEVTFFPGNGVYNDPLTDEANTYNKFDFNSVWKNPPNPSTGNRHVSPYPTALSEWASARARDSNPLGGLDVRNRFNDPGSWGPGAIDWRHPAGFLRADDVNALAVYYLLNATVCRHSGAGALEAQHIASRGVTYPAWEHDRPFTEVGGRNGKPPDYNPPWSPSNPSPPDNQGNIPYGTRMTINTARYDAVMAMSSITARGKAVVKAVYAFGILVCDGQGQIVNGGPAVQLRVDQGFTGSAAASLRTEVENALDEIAEHLWPVFDTRRHNADYPSGWTHTDGFVYIGGGGPRSPDAINNALV